MNEDAERELVQSYIDAKTKKESLEESLVQVTEELTGIESRLIEMLDNRNAVATAKYADLGFVRIEKPKVHASCNKENFNKLVEFINQEGRPDLLKQTVYSYSLSTFIAELIEHGKTIPDFISYYLSRNIKLYKGESK